MLRAKYRNGSKATLSTPPGDVRFTPESDRLVRSSEVTLCAISDQSAPQQDLGKLEL
jgi:hypothetical protein